MTKVRSILSIVATALLFASAHVFADGTLIEVKGDVRIGNDPATAQQRVISGATINTGIGAQAIIKFDDQQQIVLNENTTFKITDFRYRALEPRGDRAVFDLLRGALRFVTGIVGGRNPSVVAMRVPQATIGIRGTNYMIALVNNQAYLNVISGAVSSTNAGGVVVLGEGAIASIASASSLTTPIVASALPAAAGSAFSALSAVPLAAAVTPAVASSAAAGAAPAGAAAGTTSTVGAAVAIGVGAAVIGTAVKDSSTTTHH